MAKFRPADAFDASANAPFTMLPWRFTALDENERYVATNLVGEHLVLDRETIGKFARQELTPQDPAYDDLKARHFLIDADTGVGVDLLALKLRTKLAPLANFTALHIFVVTLRCEHSCPYCQVSRANNDRGEFDMSLDTAMKSLDLVFRSPSPALKIEFQGGESLLNLPLIKAIVEEAKRRNETARRELAFVVATNLAVLSDEALAFFKAENILVSTSLDGPADLHNANRPRPGRDSHQRAVDGIHRARRALGHYNVGALMTTTSASLDRVKAIIDEYLRLDC